MRDIAPNIGFADSSYKSCEMSNGNLVVYLNSWDNKTLKISFLNTIEFSYKIGSFTAGVFEKTDEYLLLNEALDLYYEKLPETHSFKVFVIIDIEDFPVFKVVAEEVNVVKE
ncbi:MAG: hypothetical protein WA347_05265 [Rhabdochlamydiaceae bacterium]|jgi:hypothetical protein